VVPRGPAPAQPPPPKQPSKPKAVVKYYWPKVTG
jgi:hypothetical protein